MFEYVLGHLFENHALLVHLELAIEVMQEEQEKHCSAWMCYDLMTSQAGCGHKAAREKYTVGVQDLIECC